MKRYSIIYHMLLGCLIILTSISIMTPTANAAPASGIPFKMITPQGEEVWVRAVGDENYRHFETLDGAIAAWLPRVSQTLSPIPQAQRLFPEYLKKSSQAEKNIRARKRNAAAENEAKFLIVLVDFPDRHFSVTSPLEAFTDLMNGEDYTVGGTCGSARVYFEDNSAGQFSPKFEVVGPVTMSNNARYYASVGLDDSPATKMVVEACRILEEEIDFTEYDLDGDGVCDNIYFFYAGKGQADGGGLSTIWPHSAKLSDFEVSLTADGIQIENYACSPEQNGRGQFTGIGTFCHEFCHVLGLPDLYYNGGSHHPGAFSLMASGNYNNNGYTPPALSSFERLSLGWLTPEEITASGSLELHPLPESNSAKKVTSFTNSDEYYIFENRQLEGWDKYLPGHGMLAWHIDYDPQAWADNQVNTSQRRLVDLVRANGSTGLGSSTPFPGNTHVSAFDETTYPSFTTRDGKSMKVALSNIAETSYGDITMDATISGASLDMLYPSLPNSEVTAIYDISGKLLLTEPSAEAMSSLPAGVYILQHADGTTSKHLCR